MKFLKKENGAIFVEASIVFPIMFIVILLMVFLGNAYFQKCRVEAIANEIAIRGASYCADSMLPNMESGKIPSVSGINVYPYRYLDANGVGSTVGDLAGELEDKVSGLDSGYFPQMKPKDVDADTEYHYGFIYSTFEVYVTYKIEFPIRMIGEDENISINMSTTASMPVGDSTELIRNVNMVEDYLQQLGVDKKIEALTSKIEAAVDALTNWK